MPGRGPELESYLADAQAQVEDITGLPRRQVNRMVEEYRDDLAQCDTVKEMVRLLMEVFQGMSRRPSSTVSRLMALSGREFDRELDRALGGYVAVGDEPEAEQRLVEAQRAWKTDRRNPDAMGEVVVAEEELRSLGYDDGDIMKVKMGAGATPIIQMGA